MKKIIWTLFYIFLFSILLYNSFGYLDPDFGWHLRFGEIIWQTKNIPHDQIFMWTLQGKTWVDHEWLANLLMYVVWSTGGYIMLSIFFALLPLTALFLVNNFLFKYFFKRLETQVVLAVIEIGALLAMKPHFGIRVQEITFLGIAFLLLTLQNYFLDRVKLPPWWLPILFYGWAMLHGGFLLGLGILFIWLVIETGLYFFPKIYPTTKSLSKDRLLQWYVISGISFIVTLLTPYGLKLYSFLFEYKDNFYLSHIQEWLPPYKFPINYGQIAFIFLVVSTGLAIYGVLKKKIPLFSYAITLLLTFMAIKSVRHFPLLIAAWLILILPHFLPEITARLTIPNKKFISPLTFLCLLVLSIGFFINTRFTNNPFTAYCERSPCQAARFLLGHPEYSKRIFNSYNFGGFLIGVAPDLRLFIDGRLPQYPYNDHSILAEYYEFYHFGFTRQKIDEFNISTVLHQKTQPLRKINWFEKYILGYKDNNFKQPNAVLTYISTSPNWTKVYEDNISLVYVRK